MKKLLALLLVLGLSGVASATTVSLMDPEATVDTMGMRIYIAVDLTGLEQLSVTITAAGDATITGGILASEAGDYGVEVDDWGIAIFTDGGFQSGLSFDTVITGGTKAEIGLGHYESTIYGATDLPVVVLPVLAGDLGGDYPTTVQANTPIAYIDIVATAMGSVTLTMVDGSVYGDNTLDGEGLIAGFGSPLVLNTIPEPATIVLLGLGGLLLRRRK